jgi:hypothetical protein
MAHGEVVLLSIPTRWQAQRRARGWVGHRASCPAWLLLRCLIGCRLGSGTEPLAACLLCGDRRRSSSYLLGQRTSARTSRP